MKIAYILQSLAFKGGTERVITEKANYLTEHFGYDVSIITLTQQPTESNFYHLSEQIKQINLDIHDYSVYKYKYPRRLWKKWIMNHRVRQILTEAICKICPDIIIGTAHYKADLICSIKCNATKIIECHDGRMIISILRKQWEKNLIVKMIMPYNRWKYFKTIERHADIIVTLTEGAKEKWRKANKVVVITNISTMPVKRITTCESKRIISVGRLRWEKGFERLIDIWKEVSLNYPDWQLAIFGDGALREQLTNKIQLEHVSNIFLYKSITDISNEYANSSICVVTSYFEGFSLTLLEAIRHGLPCIAFDCPFGPRSIIEDGINGYLIEEGNNNLFIQKLCSLMEKKPLRKQFSLASIERSKYFNTEDIMRQWKELFESINKK